MNGQRKFSERGEGSVAGRHLSKKAGNRFLALKSQKNMRTTNWERSAGLGAPEGVGEKNKKGSNSRKRPEKTKGGTTMEESGWVRR